MKYRTSSILAAAALLLVAGCHRRRCAQGPADKVSHGVAQVTEETREVANGMKDDLEKQSSDHE